MSTLPNPAEDLDGNQAVQAPQAAGRYACFGAFVADLEQRALYRNGQRVKVQSKLFEALLLLLSRAGDVVIREEVRCQLWPDTYLSNLDANVNTTINKLRQVLGDSPENPVYIETIPRRGYCCVSNVEFSNVRPGLVTDVATKVLATESDTGGSAKTWFEKRSHVFARGASLLFGGMILGALLVFVWFFSQAKNRHVSRGAFLGTSVAEWHIEQSTGWARDVRYSLPL